MYSLPVFLLPFLCLMFFIPILSIEGITPWILFFYFTYKILKISSNKDLGNKYILKKVFLIFITNIILVLFYNLTAYLITSFIIKNVL